MTAPVPFIEAIATRRSLASALAAMGNLQGALDALRDAQSRADSAQLSEGVRGGLTLARADLAVQFNANADAKRLYRQAEGQYRQAGDVAGQGEAQSGLGRLLVAEGDQAQGLVLLRSAMRTQAAMGSWRSAALTRLLVADAEAEHGAAGAADREYAQAAREFSAFGDPVGTAAALDGRAALAARAGRWVAADSLYRAGLRSLGGRTAQRSPGDSTPDWVRR